MCLKTSLIYLHVTKPINNDKEELRHKSNEQKKYKKKQQKTIVDGTIPKT